MLRFLHSMLSILMLLIMTYFERKVMFNDCDLVVKVPLSVVFLATVMEGINTLVIGFASLMFKSRMKSCSADFLLFSNFAKSSVHCGKVTYELMYRLKAVPMVVKSINPAISKSRKSQPMLMRFCIRLSLIMEASSCCMTNSPSL